MGDHMMQSSKSPKIEERGIDRETSRNCLEHMREFCAFPFCTDSSCSSSPSSPCIVVSGGAPPSTNAASSLLPLACNRDAYVLVCISPAAGFRKNSKLEGLGLTPPPSFFSRRWRLLVKQKERKTARKCVWSCCRAKVRT